VKKRREGTVGDGASRLYGQQAERARQIGPLGELKGDRILQEASVLPGPGQSRERKSQEADGGLATT